MLTYFIKVNIALAVFWIVYRLCFGRDTLFPLRRATLWTMALFALAWPLIVITVRVLTLPSGNSDLADIPVTVMELPAGPSFPLWMIPLVAYLSGMAFFLVRFFALLARIIMLGLNSRKRTVYGTMIRVTGHRSAPFSFFGWIFADPAKYSETEMREILAHECTHVRELHSVDVIFFELLRIAFWANPFVWLMKMSAHQNLEYLADKDVIRRGSDRRQYQYHLLQLSYQQPLSSIANHFSKSQLKNRIAMMNKKQTPRRGVVKYAFILPPLFVLLLLANVQTVPVYASDTTGPQPPEETVFMIVENMPKFDGGDVKKFRDWVASTVVYPEEAAKKKITGPVTLSFIVEKDGSVGNVEVLKGADPLLDREAVRVVMSSPKWQPGTQRGEAVRVKLTIPVRFGLVEGREKSVVQFKTGGSVTFKNADPDKQPLYILDGSEVSPEFMKNFDATDVMSITVLKDADATKAYGEKGANGVVVIVTKQDAPEVVVTGVRNKIRGLDDIKKEYLPGSRNNPLLIQDGYEIDIKKFESIDPDTIESITVLKDATATKVYGDKGANGVIIIETK